MRAIIEHAARLLPAQGPITAFVHHNTLHALEDLPFDEAVRRGGQIFGCQSYLPEDQYRRMLEQGRIRPEDVWAVIMEDLGDYADGLVGHTGTRFHLRLAMLQFPLRSASGPELRWLMAETDVLHKIRPEVSSAACRSMIDATRHWIMRDLRAPAASLHNPQRDNLLTGLLERFGESSIDQWDETKWEAVCLHLLWRVCRQGVHGLGSASAHAEGGAKRHRDLLLQAAGEDSDLLVHDFLIRFCAAMLDQGFAGWRLPERECGFYHAFIALYQQQGGPLDRWLSGLGRELRRLSSARINPLESIQESLRELGVAPDEHQGFVLETLLALRGWAGMIWQVETRGDRAAYPAPAGSLVEFLAVRLILERLALRHVARESLGFRGELCDLREAARGKLAKSDDAQLEQRAFLIFQLAQALDWKPQSLHELSKEEWKTLVQEIEAFSSAERRRVYHLAFERRFCVQALGALSVHCRRQQIESQRPRFQIVCCLDDREESFRRHLEEVAVDAETFGAAGFFSVPMYYRGAADAHFAPLCPIIIRPRHWVVERVAYNFAEEHLRRTKTRRFLGNLGRQLHLASRSLVGGAMTACIGSLASAPLVARVLYPRTTAQFRRLFGSIVAPPPVRQLVLERTGAEPAPREDHFGFSVEEMAANVERLLREIGMTRNIARLVLMIGHGSSSVNNPHESAYNCGACAGARGGPNARAFAQMANHPRVRLLLAERGLEIPSDTFFVGAYHNTCDDSVQFFDLDRLPDSHQHDFDRARKDLNEARRRNAHERCRRFESAPLDLSPEAALRHVENRSEDLAQTRPEYNHATNALTIVGRRARTRGLFLDRRAFLSSYDPTQDDENHTILAQVLEQVIPVCAGISLEYYFSTVDPAGYGCNNKLPHNVVSLLGVMLGAASDLQPGLNAQMVEIHEPMRPLFVVETTPQAMLRILDRHPAIGRLCRNAWLQLATLDPDSAQVHIYRHGEFHPPEQASPVLEEVESSLDWYRGWRDHLGFAAVRSAAQPRSPAPAAFAGTEAVQ